jgi:hypothetical protein
LDLAAKIAKSVAEIADGSLAMLAIIGSACRRRLASGTWLGVHVLAGFCDLAGFATDGSPESVAWRCFER